MFGALRRAPARLSRAFPTAAISSRALYTPISRGSTVLPIASTSTRLPQLSLATFHHSARWQQVAAQAEAQQSIDEDGPAIEFQDLATRGLVHPNVIRPIVGQMKLTTMTDVQVRTINEALSGVDVIAQAKTGTGKTLAFLIPVVQRIIQSDPSLAERSRKRAKPSDIKAIIISPTRELAEQIAVEAKKVISNTGIVVQIAVGGTQKRMMLQKTQREGCHLLVGTPGRIYDIFSDDYSGVKAPQLQALVMDEADRLLDDGFTREIDDIKQFLPNPEEVERQNLMFSATIPRNVVDLVRKTMRPGFHFAKCVSEDEEPTHERVPQKYVNLFGFENIMPSLYELILQQRELAESGQARPFKALVYFNSTAEVTLASSVFYKLGSGFKRGGPFSGFQAYEIHSKLTQGQRTRAADDFRFCKSGILFSSDVTARGMDFPNVTHVIQIGLPRDRESYIHRIGRTGRAGKEGEGWVFITPFDKHESRRRLQGLPLRDATSNLQCAMVDMSQPAEVPEQIGKILTDTVEAHKKVYPDQLDAAFRGLFGAFQGYSDRQGLLEGANRLAEFGWGMPSAPNPPSSFFSGGGRRGGGGRDRDRNRGGFGPRDGSRGFGGGDRQGFGGGDRRGFGGGDRQGSSGGDRRGSSGGERRGFGGGDRQGFGGGDRQGSGGGDRRGFGGGDRQGFGGGDRQRGGGGGERRFTNDRRDRGFGGDRPRREPRFA